MGTFAENINRICRENNTTLTSVIKQKGIAVSKVTAINKGSIPNEAMLNELADALDCHVSDFFADSSYDDRINYYVNQVTLSDPIEQQLLEVFAKLSPRNRIKLLAEAYDILDGESK